MTRKIRIKEIARQVGCSPATISQAFNNPKLVNRKTRARILEAAEQLGYVRKRFNQKRKKFIGIIGASHELMLGEYFNQTTTAIFSAARENGFNVILECFGDEENTLPLMFSKKVLDGVIILGKISQDHVLMIKQQGFPLVLCGHPIPGLELHTVLSDGRAGIYQVTKHLIGLGHKRIAHITGAPLFDQIASDRLDGFRFALSEAGLSVPEEYIAVADFCDWETAVKATDKLMRAKEPPSAIVCESDALAYTVLKRLNELGYKVPKDVSLSGYDNLPVIPSLDPTRSKLTTVDVNLKEMGKVAVNVLLDIIENPSRTAYRHTLPVQLVIGNTTAKKKSAPA